MDPTPNSGLTPDEIDAAIRATLEQRASHWNDRERRALLAVLDAADSEKHGWEIDCACPAHTHERVLAVIAEELGVGIVIHDSRIDPVGIEVSDG